MESSLNHNAADSESARHRSHQTAPPEVVAAPPQAADPAVAAPAGLLGHPALGGRGNAPVRAAAALNMQRTHGNRAVQRLLHSAPADPALADDTALADQIAARQGGGSRLAPAAQARLESGLGTGLDHVRVHTDAAADQLARSVQAVAFTTGSDIFFRSGMYNPDSPQGLRLLAHETTHTLQQAAGPVAGTEAPGGVAISDPADSFEQAADAAADTVVAGATAPTGPATPAAASGGSGSAAVQREGEEGHEEEPSVLGGLLGLAKPFATEGLEHLVEHGSETLMGGLAPMGKAAGGAIGLAAGPLEIAEGLHEGGPLGYIKAAGGTAETLGGIGKIAQGLLSGGEGAAAAAAEGGAVAAEGGALAAEGGALAAGAEGLAALGPVGAVIGAGVGGWEAGKLLDKGVNALGQAITGDDKGDYSISGGIAKGLTAADEGISGMFADPSKPAYTQTLGWKLANMFE